MRIEIMYKILYGVILILLFLVGIYIGIEISNKEEQENIIASTNNNVIIDVEPYVEETVEEIVQEETLIEVEIKYTDIYPDCGHMIETEETYKETTVDEMKQDIESRDLGYRLIGQQDGILIYQKVHNGKCLNHYKVILEDGSVKIYRLSISGEFEYYQDTEITVETIREGIKEQLEVGIEVDELEELLLLIEDIES